MKASRSVLLVSAGLLLTACGGAEERDAGSDDESSGETTTSENADETETATVAEEDVEEGDVEAEEVELVEVDGSGISGTVELSATEGGRLSLAVELDEGHEDTHGIEARRGSCDDVADPGAVDSVLSEVSTYTLPDVEDGSMETDEPLPEEVVSDGTYALVVYDGEDLDGDVVACGEVEVE